MMNQGGVSDTRTTLDQKVSLEGLHYIVLVIIGSIVRWQEKELLNSHE
ncbi:hypothetical protein HanPI659440_Chr09g0347201 [Helianthus annuus]|nr:hypothetical protein HanPI659440_Chr09g0347201 [Helianthus annuus]